VEVWDEALDVVDEIEDEVEPEPVLFLLAFVNALA
jgi:hypothetical protein